MSGISNLERQVLNLGLSPSLSEMLMVANKLTTQSFKTVATDDTARLKLLNEALTWRMKLRKLFDAGGRVDKIKEHLKQENLLTLKEFLPELPQTQAMLKQHTIWRLLYKKAFPDTLPKNPPDLNLLLMVSNMAAKTIPRLTSDEIERVRTTVQKTKAMKEEISTSLKLFQEFKLVDSKLLNRAEKLLREAKELNVKFDEIKTLEEAVVGLWWQSQATTVMFDSVGKELSNNSMKLRELNSLLENAPKGMKNLSENQTKLLKRLIGVVESGRVARESCLSLLEGDSISSALEDGTAFIESAGKILRETPYFEEKGTLKHVRAVVVWHKQTQHLWTKKTLATSHYNYKGKVYKDVVRLIKQGLEFGISTNIIEVSHSFAASVELYHRICQLLRKNATFKLLEWRRSMVEEVLEFELGDEWHRAKVLDFDGRRKTHVMLLDQDYTEELVLCPDGLCFLRQDSPPLRWRECSRRFKLSPYSPDSSSLLSKVISLQNSTGKMEATVERLDHTTGLYTLSLPENKKIQVWIHPEVLFDTTGSIRWYWTFQTSKPLSAPEPTVEKQRSKRKSTSVNQTGSSKKRQREAVSNSSKHVPAATTSPTLSKKPKEQRLMEWAFERFDELKGYASAMERNNDYIREEVRSALGKILHLKIPKLSPQDTNVTAARLEQELYTLHPFGSKSESRDSRDRYQERWGLLRTKMESSSKCCQLLVNRNLTVPLVVDACPTRREGTSHQATTNVSSAGQTAPLNQSVVNKAAIPRTPQVEQTAKSDSPAFFDFDLEDSLDIPGVKLPSFTEVTVEKPPEPEMPASPKPANVEKEKPRKQPVSTKSSSASVNGSLKPKETTTWKGQVTYGKKTHDVTMSVVDETKMLRMSHEKPKQIHRNYFLNILETPLVCKGGTRLNEFHTYFEESDKSKSREVFIAELKGGDGMMKVLVEKERVGAIKLRDNRDGAKLYIVPSKLARKLKFIAKEVYKDCAAVLLVFVKPTFFPTLCGKVPLTNSNGSKVNKSNGRIVEILNVRDMAKDKEIVAENGSQDEGDSKPDEEKKDSPPAKSDAKSEGEQKATDIDLDVEMDTGSHEVVVAVDKEEQKGGETVPNETKETEEKEMDSENQDLFDINGDNILQNHGVGSALSKESLMLLGKTDEIKRLEMTLRNLVPTLPEQPAVSSP